MSLRSERICLLWKELSPFNQAKYDALLKGLEIVEKKLSYAQNNKDYRLDSGFYTSEIKQSRKLDLSKNWRLS